MRGGRATVSSGFVTVGVGIGFLGELFTEQPVGWDDSDLRHSPALTGRAKARIGLALVVSHISKSRCGAPFFVVCTRRVQFA